MTWLRCADAALFKLVSLLAQLFLLAAVLVGFWQVVTRFMLESPADWSEITTRALLIWAGAVGRGAGVSPRGHAGGGFFAHPAGRPWPSACWPGWWGVICMGFLGMLAWVGGQMVWRVRFQTLPSLEISHLLGVPGHPRRGQPGRDCRTGPLARPGGGYRSCATMPKAKHKEASAMSHVMILSDAGVFRPDGAHCHLHWPGGHGGVAIAGLPWLVIAQQMYAALDKFPLAAIPFFILAGNLMEAGGISERLVDFAKSLVGGVQGGLAMACVITCMIFAAVAGSSVATTFAVGAISIPAMVRHGYPAPFAASLQATAAELGVSFRRRFP